MLAGDSSHQVQAGSECSELSRTNQDRQPEEGGRWYFSRKEIEDGSPSRRDGIDLKRETFLRKSYCTFLQDFGMRLKVPQITIATAIIFCHRFFLRHSHKKNDSKTIATVCMFLAGKVEETPRPLKDVIVVSYEIINKKDPAAAQRIKQKEVYEQQKELILLGERVVLATLGFDLNVHHPYKPLVEAIKKFKVAQNALAQVAWNFVNDGLRTSLCLQFMPHHIAAGAIFLAAKFLKVKLPSDGEKVWWQEFDVTPRQLEEVSNQMLELYEQNKCPPQGSEAEGSAGGGPAHRDPTTRPPVGIDEQASRQPTSRLPTGDNHGVPARSSKDQNNDNGSAEMGSSVINDNHKLDKETKDDNMKEIPSRGEEDEERAEAGERRHMDVLEEAPVEQSSPKEASKLLDKVKLKAAAALERKKKSRGGETSRKKDVMDEDDLIERAIEDGVELAARPKSDNVVEGGGNEHEEIVEGRKGHTSREYAEEGEMVDEASPMMNNNNRKRKTGSPTDRQSKQRHDYNDIGDDGHRMGRGSCVDNKREHRKQHPQPHAHPHDY